MGKEKSNNNHNGKDKSWEIIEFSEGEVKIKIDDETEIVALLFSDEKINEIKEIKRSLKYPYSQVNYVQ